jgi:hypothetical protein
MSPIPASSVAAGALSPVGNAPRVEGWPFVDNPYSPGRRRKGWRYRQSLPLLPIGWSPHCRLPRRYGHPPAAQVSASHLWSLMQWRLLLRSGLNLLTRRRLRCLWWPMGEKHQRAWEAELLAFSETMTLVKAAIRGPIAADAAMEHESLALAMSLGGAISRVYVFFRIWLALVIP